MSGIHILVLIGFTVLSKCYCDRPLRAELLNELKCSNTIPKYDGKLNYIWMSTPTTWYISMGSERAYRLTAEILLGRPASNFTELDKMDPNVSVLMPFYKINGYGDKFFRKICLPKEISLLKFPKNLLENTCHSFGASNGADVGPNRKAVDTLAWTDNANAVLIIPCNEMTNMMDWFVLSKVPKLAKETSNIILTIVKKMGFNVKNAVYYDYNKKRIVRNNK